MKNEFVFEYEDSFYRAQQLINLEIPEARFLNILGMS